MIQVDISNIWGRLSLPDLLKIEAEVAEAHRLLLVEGYPEGTEEEYLGWGFENPLWLYAGVRNLMLRSGKTEERLVTAAAEAAKLWLEQFAGDALAAASAENFTADREELFETCLLLAPPDEDFLTRLERHTDGGAAVVCIECSGSLDRLDRFFHCARLLSDQIRQLSFSRNSF